MRKKIKPFKVIIIAFISFALVFLTIFTRIFPMAHNGTSLTPFKIASEYVIICLLGLSGLLTWRERSFFGKGPNRLVLAFLSSMVASELLFTLYAGAYELPNMLGHLFKIVAYAFAYKAIVQSTLEAPLQSIFKKLVETDRDLEKRNRELVMYTTKLQQEIVERKKAEDTLRQFISTLSHEIRTPATVLDQSVQTFVKYNERMSTEQETALIAAISRNMVIMNDLVENVQDLTRIDDHKLQLDVAPVDFKAIILDIVKVMDNSIRAKVMHVDVSIDDGIVFSGDARKITHITMALVDNAVKFSPRGSKFTIMVKDRYKGGYNKDDLDGVLLQVADNGMGIDEDLLPRLFERFARSAQVQDIPGSGLGLAIAKEFVAMHGGKIYVTTQVDKGTTFSVFLPRRNLDNTHGLNRG
jgi:two-component system phosphate regulon sensor histidine kinase PhoR